MLRALIFDFNGVIIDDEPIHLAAFRDVLAREGIALSDEEYWNELAGYDDRGVFTLLLQRTTGQAEPVHVQALTDAKSREYDRMTAEGAPLFPGVQEFIARAAARYHVAVCSGALRREIDMHLTQNGLQEYFPIIIAAEDTERGKPDPEGYLTALRAVNARGEGADIQPNECLVIEDSHAGITAAKTAGMYCVAVSNTYPADALAGADWVVDSLHGVSLDEWEARLR